MVKYRLMEGYRGVFYAQVKTGWFWWWFCSYSGECSMRRSFTTALKAMEACQEDYRDRIFKPRVWDVTDEVVKSVENEDPR